MECIPAITIYSMEISALRQQETEVSFNIGGQKVSLLSDFSNHEVRLVTEMWSAALGKAQPTKFSQFNVSFAHE